MAAFPSPTLPLSFTHDASLRGVDSPNSPLLATFLVESADVSPERLVKILHFVQLLYNRSTEVDRKVGAVIVDNCPQDKNCDSDLGLDCVFAP